MKWHSQACMHNNTTYQLINQLLELIINIFLSNTHEGAIRYNVGTIKYGHGDMIMCGEGGRRNE